MESTPSLMSDTTSTASNSSDDSSPKPGFDEELEGLAEYEKYLTAGARFAERQRLRKAEDVREALENIYEELESLTARTGIRILLLTARGQYEDIIEPKIFETGEGMDFMRTVFAMDSAELAARLDAWAVTKGGARA
ncbi:hypothetical protein B0H14DRAFT_2804167 [Mycena olivaceomarginata]|nr:hypothetical protein B0H14DRAFT_3027104 [Mycena olivaceomarginata]KAJ7831862.1 hypothetical protein B0H14DRAFT_2804167 [Mycena olivaceomarginata]